MGFDVALMDLPLSVHRDRSIHRYRGHHRTCALRLRGLGFDYELYRMMEIWLNLFRRTPREYYADFFITPPITAGLLFLSVIYADIFWPVKFGFGWLLWSLYEYVTHRWVSHGFPFFREAHALHHRSQRDYISLHPVVTLAIYLVFWALFGFGYGAVSVGFSCGYVFYAIAHTSFHYATIDPGHFLYGLKMRHAVHHRADVNFGVSSALWDRVFRTEFVIRVQ